MLGTILRSRVLPLPGSTLSITRFFPVLPSSSRVPLASALPRFFSASQISNEYGYEDRRGGLQGRPNDPYSREQPRGPKNPPSATIWIGNLPFSSRTSEVESLFSEFGHAKSVRLGTLPSGESRGFAHVDFGDVAVAETVMNANAEAQFFLEGRPLAMDYALAPVVRDNPPKETLHIADYSGDEALLEETFKEFGDAVREIRLVRNAQTNASSRFGFVTFATVEDATAALEKLHGKEIAYGETLKLSYVRERREQPARFSNNGGDREGGYSAEGSIRGGRGGGRGGYGGGRPREFNDRGPPRNYGGDGSQYRPRQDSGGRGGSSSWSPRGGRDDRPSYGRSSGGDHGY